MKKLLLSLILFCTITQTYTMMRQGLNYFEKAVQASRIRALCKQLEVGQNFKNPTATIKKEEESMLESIKPMLIFKSAGLCCKVLSITFLCYFPLEIISKKPDFFDLNNLF